MRKDKRHNQVIIHNNVDGYLVQELSSVIIIIINLIRFSSIRLKFNKIRDILLRELQNIELYSTDMLCISLIHQL